MAITTFYRIICQSLLLVCLISTLKANGDPTRGQQWSSTCVACHNADGNSTVGMWPKIAGQHSDYLLKQLREFKKGENGQRNNAQMAQMVAEFNDEQLQDLAAYFASQTMSEGAADASKVALGKQIYKGGLIEKGIPACASCHGPQGLGNAPANFPKLNGQHAEYTLSQLNAFKSGIRQNDENAIMRMMAAKMSDEEMQAVSQYIEGLH